MDARRLCGALIACALICSSSAAWTQTLYRAESTNFSVTAPDRKLAQEVASQAEAYRRTLAAEWLGRHLDNWTEKCPIQVELAALPGGETSFLFVGPPGSSEPVGWQMKVFGPPDRILDSVLPHEVTHTIFATHFRRPLPRWADEGACTTVEHASERDKNHRMLINFLSARPSRGIPFNRMFTMKQYPHDILPLYAQGHSLARYLINHKGKRHFVAYLQAGLNQEDQADELSAWTEVTRDFYGHQDLSDLQVAWVHWVKAGCPNQVGPLADAADSGTSTSGLASQQSLQEPAVEAQLLTASADQTVASESWYRQQMVAAKTSPPTAETQLETEPAVNREAAGPAESQIYAFAPGSTARADVSILQKTAVRTPANHQWQAIPVSQKSPAPVGSANATARGQRDNGATIWR